jgi:type VI secretion system protein ImpM
LPGAAGAQAWAGVLMPSVDRVGRYFPLTLVQPLGTGPASTQQLTGLWHWLSRLDDLARDALYEDWTADRLEAELARMARPELSPAPVQEPQSPAAEGSLVEVPAQRGTDAALHIGVEAQRAWAGIARGRAWWHARPDVGEPRLLLSRGLPAASAMARLFGPTATR